MAGERILVVDDGPENVEFIVNYVLKPNGYISLTASDGATGLHRALTENPDLILLDMQMPRMTGVEVLEALRAQNKDIPAILMTFHGSEELVIRVLRLGVKDYIQKPFGVEELLTAIDRALAEVRLRRERDELTERLLASNRQLEARLKELNILYSIGKSVTAELELNTLFSRLVDAAVYLTGAEEGWLMLVDDKTDELYICAAKGLEERHARSLRLRVEDSIAGTVIKSGEPVVINSGQHKVKTAYLVRSLMAVPIKIGGRAIGVLNVDFRQTGRPFGSSNLHLLAALADYAAIAIQNAKLFNDIRDARGKLEAILTGTADGILVTDPQQRVILLNEAAGRILGCCPTEQVIGHSIDQLSLPPELYTLFEQRVDVLTDSRIELPGRDGRTYNAHLTDVAGVGFVVVIQDVTHFKELEAIKNEFVSTVSHDLRSPLTAIRGFADLIEMVGPLNEQQKTFMQKIRNSVADITELITDLLDLSRIERGADFEMTPIDLETLIVESVEMLRGQAVAKNQRLEVSLTELPPVMGNRVRLGQVVKNLVGNAIKYTPEGGYIHVSAETRDGQVLVRVQDSGIGISADDQSRLFQKFYRVKRPETDNIPGTGLGLAIAQGIVEQHGGRIWVESELNRGSTFTFLLPVYEPR